MQLDLEAIQIKGKSISEIKITITFLKQFGKKLIIPKYQYTKTNSNPFSQEPCPKNNITNTPNSQSRLFSNKKGQNQTSPPQKIRNFEIILTKLKLP